MLPSLPARTAAGGFAGPKGWGPWLIASIAALSSLVLIRQLRLGEP